MKLRQLPRTKSGKDVRKPVDDRPISTSKHNQNAGGGSSRSPRLPRASPGRLGMGRNSLLIASHRLPKQGLAESSKRAREPWRVYGESIAPRHTWTSFSVGTWWSDGVRGLDVGSVLLPFFLLLFFGGGRGRDGGWGRRWELVRLIDSIFAGLCHHSFCWRSRLDFLRLWSTRRVGKMTYDVCLLFFYFFLFFFFLFFFFLFFFFFPHPLSLSLSFSRSL